MDVEANNNGGATGGNRKYPNEHGYVADQGINLFDGDGFDELSRVCVRICEELIEAEPS